MNRKITKADIQKAKQYNKIANKRLAESIMRNIKLSLNKSLNEGRLNKFLESTKFDDNKFCKSLAPAINRLFECVKDDLIQKFNIVAYTVWPTDKQIIGTFTKQLYQEGSVDDDAILFLEDSTKRAQDEFNDDIIKAMNNSIIDMYIKIHSDNGQSIMQQFDDPKEGLKNTDPDPNIIKVGNVKLLRIISGEWLIIRVTSASLTRYGADSFIDFIYSDDDMKYIRSHKRC